MIITDKARIAAAFKSAILNSNVGTSALGNVNVNDTLSINHIEEARAGANYITPESPMYHLVAAGTKRRFQVSSQAIPALRCVKASDAVGLDLSGVKTAQDLTGVAQVTYLKPLVDELDGQVSIDTMSLKCIGKFVRTTDNNEPALQPRFYKGYQAYRQAMQDDPNNGSQALSALHASGVLSTAANMTPISHPANYAWTPVFSVSF